MRLRSLPSALALVATLQGQDLQPFRMPWNDATPTITSLQSWQPVEAGATGWVAVTPDGHYAVNEQRIRFLGVNVTSANAFPSRDRADAHAARLAKFGFNGVRFHHMEAPWDKQNVLTDYAKGTSRDLNPSRLDRLHYFIAALARHGIYSNLNLLVSREFQPADGLGPEIAQMGWKDQHTLGFFNQTALDLHKEFATKLLTAPNPHRADNIPLGKDPAVAMVEIMNENGLLQKWYEGVLDTMPATYRAQLESRWNSWLRGRYENNAAMLSAWGAVDQPLGDNKLSNGDFSSGTSRWTIERHTTAVATTTIADDFDGKPALRIQVTTPGSANWHVQLNQSAIPVEANTVYTLSFWARANTTTPVSAGVQRAHSDYASLAPGLNVSVGTTWREYSITFQNGTTESNARVNFNGFGDRTPTVWFAGIRLQQGGRIGALPNGRTLEEGNIPNVAARGSAATLEQRRDWVRFVLATESSYWTTMYKHVKEEVGYPGIVFGTIISNSPPNVQAALDAIDSHTYWQHPSFPPGLDFNAEQWTVQNVSMVNDANGGVIAGLSRQRVAGKPHNVTEHMHCSPNTFASEGPLLGAAYAAFQDWDSLWFFEYPTGTSEFNTGFFDQSGHPGRMVNTVLAATMFRRGDVAPGSEQITFAMPPDREIDVATTRGGQWSIADGSHLGVPGSLALLKRIALSTGDAATGLTTPPAAPLGNVRTSDTGELSWNNSRAGKGVVTVNTARTKAVVGFTAGRAFDLGTVTIAPGSTRQDWSTIAITLLEGESFDSSAGARALITATGDQENTSQEWKDAAKTSVGSRWGRAPVLVEVIPGTVTLPVPAARVKAWTLTPTGERETELSIADVEGKARIEIGKNGATLWYEVVIEPEP